MWPAALESIGMFSAPGTVPAWTSSTGRVSIRARSPSSRPRVELLGRDLAGRHALAEQGGALLVLALHPGEVGVGVGLAVQQLVDEALLVVVLEVLAPPGEVPLVARRRSRAGRRSPCRRRSRRRGRGTPAHGRAG